MPLPKDPLERNIVTTSIVSEPPRYGATPRQPMTSPVDQEEDGNPLRESRWRIPLSSFEGYVASMQQSQSGFAEQLTGRSLRDGQGACTRVGESSRKF
ncbi:hypothetical protein BSL78_16204 [Apostichopus japonicus]|uniref:Uncharacterized protein n=1 Tax=Stichopus japonicus TaxID=307972 RepID=A0A2G8KG12_STIJA|nr:hypothetical protein BSL78_16204 [Apostichopus japonicus]